MAEVGCTPGILFQRGCWPSAAGKNKPLEADEIEFLDELVTEQQEREAAVRSAEASALSQFHAARQTPTLVDTDVSQQPQTPASLRPAPRIKKAVAVKGRLKVAKKSPEDGGVALDAKGAEGATAPPAAKPALSALLGGYGSDSDDSDE